MRRRRREYEEHAARVQRNSYMAVGWTEDPLGTVTNGGFTAYALDFDRAATLTLYVTDGPQLMKGEFPLHTFSSVKIEQRSDLLPEYAAAHADQLAKSESEDIVVAYRTAMGIEAAEIFTILPMDPGTAQQWANLLQRHGATLHEPPELAEWDTPAWTQEQRDHLSKTLDDGDIPHRWKGTVLQTGVLNRQAVLDVFASLGVT